MWYVFADEEVIVLHSKGLNWLIDFQPGSNFVAAPLNRGSRGDSYIESSSYFIPLLTTWSKNILQGVRMQNVMFWTASLVWSWAVEIYAWTTIETKFCKSGNSVAVLGKLTLSSAVWPFLGKHNGQNHIIVSKNKWCLFYPKNL